jgi:hypothetical protein
MALVVPDICEQTILSLLLGVTTNPGNQVLKLFKSSTTVPNESTVLSEFVEANQAGYSDKTLTGTSWTISTATGTTTATYSEQTFTFTEAAAIYGYYIVTSEPTPRLLWAERFTSAPFTLPTSGGTIAITPKIGAE